VTDDCFREALMAAGGVLAGRVVVVTGAGHGIGRAIARLAAAEGASVMVADISDSGQQTALDITEGGGTAQDARCDVSDPDQVSQLMTSTRERFGAIDVLVNNAGIGGEAARLHEVSLDSWDRTVAVNLRGPFLCAKFAIPHLLETGHGVIVNIASTYGLVGAPLSPAYCATKGAVVNLTRQLAVDYGHQNLRVNAICPGYVDTDMGGHRARMPRAEAEAALARREAHAAQQPLGRQASADEIARVAVFLASEASSFVTGAIIPVDGGCTTTFNHGQ